MQYNLKDKIEITDEFLNELISKSWQEADTLKQQILNIDVDTNRGCDVAKLLKNMSTNYYVLIGCLEALLDKDEKAVFNEIEEPTPEPVQQNVDEPVLKADDLSFSIVDINAVPEPFEYFVDFDDPAGEPLTDEDLYK